MPSQAPQKPDGSAQAAYRAKFEEALRRVRAQHPYDRAVRQSERRLLTGDPSSSWYVKQGLGLAPIPFRIGKRSVAWSFQELLAHLEVEKAERDRGTS
jgi:hypothetical protein